MSNMRWIIPLSLFFSGAWASASTQVIFANDGSKATILFLAITNNPDSTDLYGMMTAPEQDMNGRLTKKFSLPDFSAVCVFSKSAAGPGSCAITLKASPHLSMSPAQRALRYRMEGAEAASAAANFNLTGTYRSSDSHFSIQSEPGKFILEYR